MSLWRHRWSALVLVPGIIGLLRVWNDQAMPAWRELASSRAKLDSLTQLSQELPAKRKTWSQLQQQRQNSKHGDSTQTVSQLQAILESSGVSHAPLRVDMNAGTRSVKLKLLGPFLQVAQTIKRLEAYGAVPVQWDMHPFGRSNDIQCEMELHLDQKPMMP